MNTCEVKGYTKMFKGKPVKVKGYSRRVGIRGVHTAPSKKSKAPGDELREKVVKEVAEQALKGPIYAPKTKESQDWDNKVRQMSLDYYSKFSKKNKQKFDVSKITKVSKKKKSLLDKLSDELGILSGRRRG